MSCSLTAMASIRTGLYGGSFHPIHQGHLAVADYFCRNNLVDELWWVVSPQNPLKNSQYEGHAQLRLQEARNILQAYPQFVVSDVEFHLPRPSYMAQTLRHLCKMHPERTFSLIIGGDNLDEFTRWKDYLFLLEHFDILVYPRPGSTNEVPEDWHRVTLFKDAPQIDISSTAIRNGKIPHRLNQI